MAKKPRVYKKGAPGSEYDAYHGKPEQVARRAQRNEARAKAEASGKVSPGDSNEVHHPGSHRTGKLPSKTAVISKTANRKIQPKRGK